VCFLSRLQFAGCCGDSTKGSRRFGATLSVYFSSSTGIRKVGRGVGGDLQTDSQNAVVRWDKFDSAESYGDHGETGGFDSSAKGKSSVVPRNLRTPRALPLGASRSKYRRKILPMYKEKKESKVETLRLTKKEKSEKSRWVLWAEMMRRVFSEDISSCVNCGEIIGSGCCDSSPSYDYGSGWVVGIDVWERSAECGIGVGADSQ